MTDFLPSMGGVYVGGKKSDRSLYWRVGLGIFNDIDFYDLCVLVAAYSDGVLGSIFLSGFIGWV
jgi:hypothetical protein